MYIINSVKKLGSTCQEMRRLHQLKLLRKAIQLLCLFMGFDLLVYINIIEDNTKQAAYANNISCVGKVKNMLTWWNKLNTLDTFQKQKKSWLIVKL